MKHKDMQVYVGRSEGGCEDVGHLNLYNYTLLEDDRLFELEAAEKDLTALRAKLKQIEPVYLFRRKGFDEFCTCSKERYDELAQKKMFEVKKLYALTDI